MDTGFVLCEAELNLLYNLYEIEAKKNDFN
jgi:hypothetical protein